MNTRRERSMARQAIRHEGDSAEKLFDVLLRDTRRPEKQKDGDRVVVIDGDAEPVEIKECHAAPGKSGTLNQIRPIKYITCVVHAPARECWYVIPAHALVTLAARKTRGQHNEIPFECCNLSLNTLEEFRCTDRQLEARVKQAIRESRKNAALREAMTSLTRELKALGDRYKRMIG